MECSSGWCWEVPCELKVLCGEWLPEGVGCCNGAELAGGCCECCECCWGQTWENIVDKKVLKLWCSNVRHFVLARCCQGAAQVLPRCCPGTVVAVSRLAEVQPKCCPDNA